MEVKFEASTARNLYAQIAEFLEAAIATGETAGTAAKEAKEQISEPEQVGSAQVGSAQVGSAQVGSAQKAPSKKKAAGKRKRRTKAQIEEDKKKAEQEKQKTEDAADPFGEEFEQEPETTAAVTMDQARAALKDVHLVEGTKVTQLILARYGVKRFVDVPEENYADLVARCKDPKEIDTLVKQANQ